MLRSVGPYTTHPQADQVEEFAPPRIGGGDDGERCTLWMGGDHHLVVQVGRSGWVDAFRESVTNAFTINVLAGNKEGAAAAL